MAKTNPTRAVILAAIEKVERYGLSLTPENVRANVEVDGLTLADAHEALRRQINAQIPILLKETGHIIADASTRVRKVFWECGPDELEEQRRIQEQSSDYDRIRIACANQVIAFLREKQKTFGYEVCPGLFHSEIDRIYSMHGLAAPGAREAA